MLGQLLHLGGRRGRRRRGRGRGGEEPLLHLQDDELHVEDVGGLGAALGLVHLGHLHHLLARPEDEDNEDDEDDDDNRGG